MQDYFLSICIPTYNRSTYLDKMLNNLTRQIDELNLTDVQVCVSDNGSTDNTVEVLEKYSSKYKYIIRTRNFRNFGYDVNVCNTINLADGKYIWFLSDDDIVNEGAIRIIHEVLSKNYDLSLLCIKPLFFKNRIIEQELHPEFAIYQDKNSALSDIGKPSIMSTT